VRFSIGVRKTNIKKWNGGEMVGEYSGEKKQIRLPTQRVINLVWISKQGCRERFGMVYAIRGGSSQLGEVK
jgi:hypothetical protein